MIFWMQVPVEHFDDVRKILQKKKNQTTVLNGSNGATPNQAESVESKEL